MGAVVTMEEFYKDMEAKSLSVQLDQDKNLEEQWKAAVKRNADNGRRPQDTILKIPFRPRRKVLDALGTKDVKLGARHHPPETTIDEHGCSTRKNGYFVVYVQRKGWFCVNYDDSEP